MTGKSERLPRPLLHHTRRSQGWLERHQQPSQTRAAWCCDRSRPVRAYAPGRILRPAEEPRRVSRGGGISGTVSYWMISVVAVLVAASASVRRTSAGACAAPGGGRLAAATVTAASSAIPA